MILLSCLTANGQQKIAEQSQQNRTMPMYPKLFFSYDNEGNQTERRFDWSNTAKSANTIPKEIVTIKEENLQEIPVDDTISYYPNPVKDELFLQWELSQDNIVSTIHVYDLNMQLLQSYSNGNKANAMAISFTNYPTGVYAVVLVYNNGNQKSIKIIKQ